MNLIKKILLIFIIQNISSAYAKSAPDSFADLAEQLMPSVVNISTTQTIKTTSNSNLILPIPLYDLYTISEHACFSPLVKSKSKS